MEQGTGPGWVLAGRYRVEYALGPGGSGQVWVAYDEVEGVRVEVEALGVAGPAGEERVGRLGRAVARLRGHPNLASLYDVVEARGLLWGVRQRVLGASLADELVSADRMPEERVRDVAEALLDALSALHEAGVVHGDVRPANVRRDEEGRWVLLLGFGAMALEDDTTTVTGSFLGGTADYIAPELVSGGPAGPSSDIFALGAIVYHLLSGRAPFHRDSVMATLQAVARGELPSPPGGSGGLTRLVTALLDPDPEERPTAVQARRLLDRAGSPAAASVERKMSVPARSSHTISPATWLLALALALVVAVTRAHVTVSDASGLFRVLLPWAVFTVGLCLLAVQARAALARHRGRARVPVWRGYVRSLAPPARWSDEERARRRADAERAVDAVLLTVDRRVAAASPGAGAGADGGAADV